MAHDGTGPVESQEEFGPEVTAKRERAEALEQEAPHLGSFFAEQVALMKARATGQAKPIPLPWPDVEEALGGGLWPGLHVFTGATGTGKTQFAMQVAWKASGAGVPVLYVGLELGKLDITARVLALAEGDATGRTPKWSDLYLGKNDSSGARLEELAARHGNTIAERPFRAEFGPPHGWDFTLLEQRVRAMREEFPEKQPGSLPILVVLDFLQAVGAPEKDARMELRQRIGQAAYAGRAVARDHGAAVLMISSVSRDGASRARLSTDGGGDKGVVVKGVNDVNGVAPTHPGDLVGMGKESGDIEFAADSVMTLVPGEFNKRSHTRPMYLGLAKMRAGQLKWCSLEFDGSTFQSGLVMGGEDGDE